MAGFAGEPSDTNSQPEPMTLSTRSDLPTLASHISLHIIGDQGLILDSHRQTLHAATGPDTLLLCCLAEGMTQDDVLARLRGQLDLSQEQAARRLALALSVWHEAGLLDGDSHSDDSEDAWLSPADAAFRRAIDLAANSATGIADSRPRGGQHNDIRMLDTTFTIAFPDADLQEVCAGVLSRLAVAEPTADHLRLTITRQRDGFALLAGTQSLTYCDLANQVPLMVLATAGRAAACRSNAALALHAGVVRINAGAALLIGPAGTGKSTLVAGLAAAGYGALCDDTALLAGDTFDVRPLRTGVWIKRGSWPVIGPRFADHGGTTERLRPDGQNVRLLPVESALSASTGNDHLPARRIVFPSFDASAQPSIDRLDPAMALKSLIAHVYLLDRRLDAALVEHLVEWISAIPCYRIRYPSLDAAIDQFRSIAR